MIRRGRIGRPGLVGTMARTAVIAGTATAVSGAVSGGMRNSQAQKAQAQEQQAEAYQQQGYQQAQADAASAAQAASVQAQLDQLQAAQAAAAPAPAAGGDDLMAQIEKLAALKNAGVLSDAEFAAAKAKLLGV